jgi:hypothetical protein
MNDEKSFVITSWYDNKRVLMITNFFGKQPVGKCTRYDKKKRGKVSIAQPAAVDLYSYMGGVDKSDMMLSLYHTKY